MYPDALMISKSYLDYRSAVAISDDHLVAPNQRPSFVRAPDEDRPGLRATDRR